MNIHISVTRPELAEMNMEVNDLKIHVIDTLDEKGDVDLPAYNVEVVIGE